MYQVLLVDDERMILEGISAIVDWEAQGAALAGTARNGLEALDFIEESLPDIVISDITMPGLDGMGLIEECHKRYPSIKWIFLSGYNEFEYAQKAMRYGVKHYLLKPCNEEIISEALKDVVEELQNQAEESLYLKSMENKANSALEEEKELLFKEVLTNPTITEEKEVYFYSNYLNLRSEQEPVRLILFHLEDFYELSGLRQVRKAVEQRLEEGKILVSTIIGNDLVILLSGYYESEYLTSLITEIQSNQFDQLDHVLTVVISHQSDIRGIYPVYQKIAKYEDEKFYAGKGSIIFQDSFTRHGTNDRELYEYDMEKLSLLVKSDMQTEAMQELVKVVNKIKMMKLNPALAKSYLIQLYLSIKRINSPIIGEADMQEINSLESKETLTSFHQALEEELKKTIITDRSRKQFRYSSAVLNMLEVIDQNLENPDLSLQWVANEALYMNTDYLGKLFKKEVGEKFSTYVMNKRVDKAVEIIESENNVRVFELAERIGLGNNPQYFSQIFKKRTGCTPSDIIKSN